MARVFKYIEKHSVINCTWYAFDFIALFLMDDFYFKSSTIK